MNNNESDDENENDRNDDAERSTNLRDGKSTKPGEGMEGFDDIMVVGRLRMQKRISSSSSSVVVSIVAMK